MRFLRIPGTILLAGGLALSVSAGPGKYVKTLGKAHEARQAGDLQRASKLCLKARRLRPERVEPVIGLAYVLAELEDEEAFWSTLREAAEMGFGRPETIATEPALQPYRDDPRFEEILSRIKKNEDEMRAALRAANERRPPDEAPAFSSHAELVDAFAQESKRSAKELEGVSYEDRELFERGHRMRAIAALERYLAEHPEASDRHEAALDRVRRFLWRLDLFVGRWDEAWARDLADASAAFLEDYPETADRSEVGLYRLLAGVLGTRPADWDYITHEPSPLRCEPAMDELRDLASRAAEDKWSAAALGYLAQCLHDTAPADKDAVRTAIAAYRALPEPDWAERTPFHLRLSAQLTVLGMRVDGLPDFKAKILDGEEIGPDNLPGDYVLLEFWAPG